MVGYAAPYPAKQSTTVTGGYLYEKRLLDGLRDLGVHYSAGNQLPAIYRMQD